MAAPKAPVLQPGKANGEVTLDAAVFAAEIKPHLVHETVRAEMNAARAGTRGAKTRGMVSGGGAKPWRQKGTGRARAGTSRSPIWTKGGVAFAPQMRSFEVKVNRKARHAALRGALSDHAQGGTLGVVDSAAFTVPSTKAAAALLAAWGKSTPTVVVATEHEVNVFKSFRNLDRVVVVLPSEVEVVALVWARSLLVTEASLELLQRRAA
jgi:large subunit ribosomal protein L4